MLLHELLDHAANRAPDAVALVIDGTTRTFAELAERVARTSGLLREHAQPGDRVAIVADNHRAWVDCYYGGPRAGLIVTPINQRLSPGEQAALLAAADPALVLGESTYLDPLREHVSSPMLAIDDAWDEHVAAATAVAPTPGDAAWLLFTSGTTGRPKGAVLTNTSLVAAAVNTALARPMGDDDVFLTGYPLCHVTAYNLLVFHLAARPTVVLRRFDAAAAATAIRQHHVTVWSVAPTMLVDLLAHVDATGETLPTLRNVNAGAAPIPPAVRRRAEEELGITLREGYGMTELSGNAVFDGRPGALVSVRLAEDGEILVRGDQVTAGYWRDDETTAAAFTDGWFRTGDVGRWDGDRLHVVDRVKDIVITGGENVASREVEDVLHEHAGVAAAAVVGVPDERWGEAICAVVVRRRGASPTPEELVAHVRARLAGFKQPRHVVFVDELPMSSTGKVQKADLRRMAAEVLARAQ